MYEKTLFEKSFYNEHSTICFDEKLISGKHIYINEYSFKFDYNKDDMEFIAELLDAVFYRLKQNMKTKRDIFELEQYKKLQSVLLEILN